MISADPLHAPAPYAPEKLLLNGLHEELRKEGESVKTASPFHDCQTAEAEERVWIPAQIITNL